MDFHENNNVLTAHIIPWSWKVKGISSSQKDKKIFTEYPVLSNDVLNSFYLFATRPTNKSIKFSMARDKKFN